MAVDYNPRIVTDGLVLALDAGNTKSYDSSPLTITYVGGTSEFNLSSSFTLSGLQPGDLVLYFGADDIDNLNTPTGASWTAIPGLPTQPENNNKPDSAAFYVFATGTSVTASGLPTTNEHVHVMIAFRNVDPTNPFDVNSVQVTGEILPDPPAITPVTDNSMIVVVGFMDDDDVANTISPPTGYTTAVNIDSLGGSNQSDNEGNTIMTAYKLLATAAGENPSNFTSSVGSDSNKGISIALRPGSSLTWTDLFGSNNGTLTGGPTFSSGNGGYLDFDGTDDYITLPTNFFSFPSQTTFTISLWFKSSQTTGGTLFGQTNNSNPISANGYVPVIYLKTDGSIRIEPFWTGNSGNFIESSSGLNDNNWHNIITTFNSGTNQLYIDGSYVSQRTGLNLTSFTSTYYYFIGAGREGTRNLGTDVFSGNISNFSFYNKALTQEEILQNYNALRVRYGI